MNTKTKRRIASWVLLAVFVPMVLLSSLHVHPSGSGADAECAACVQHHCHGHLSALANPVHACVLCQLMTLSYVAAAAAVAALIVNSVHQLLRGLSAPQVSARPLGVVVMRGPPAV